MDNHWGLSTVSRLCRVVYRDGSRGIRLVNCQLLSLESVERAVKDDSELKIG